MRKTAILLITCFLLPNFLISNALAQIRTSFLISSNGTINYPASLILSTDFEDAVKVSDHQLNLPIRHWFEFAANHEGSGDGEGGARMWVETSFSHSGMKCIGLEVFNLSLSRRAEFEVLDMQNLVGDEATVSAWLYLPSDFNLNVPGINWNWYEIGTIADANPPSYLPYFAVHIFQPDITKKVFDVAINNRKLDNTMTEIARTNNFPLPLGRWFQIKYYILRHETKGVLKIWIDGQLVSNVSGISTRYSSAWQIYVAKVYTEPDEPKTQRIWIDDLEIWAGSH